MSMPYLACSRHCDRVMEFSRAARAFAAQDKDLGMLRADVPGASEMEKASLDMVDFWCQEKWASCMRACDGDPQFIRAGPRLN